MKNVEYNVVSMQERTHTYSVVSLEAIFCQLRSQMAKMASTFVRIYGVPEYDNKTHGQRRRRRRTPAKNVGRLTRGIGCVPQRSTIEEEGHGMQTHVLCNSFCWYSVVCLVMAQQRPVNLVAPYLALVMFCRDS